MQSSKLIEQAWQVLREEVPFYDRDRYFAPDIERARDMISRGLLVGVLPSDLLGF